MATRRETQFDRATRTFWGRAFVALVVATAVVGVWAGSFTFFRDTLDLEFLAYPVGVLAAIGGWQFVGAVFRKGGVKANPTRMSLGALQSRTGKMLKGLSPVLYRVHPIGGPKQQWPKAIVAPTGVYVLVPTLFRYDLAASPNGEPMMNGRVVEDEIYGPTSRVRRNLMTMLVDGHDIDLPVMGLVVVDNGVFIPGMLRGASTTLRIVRIDEIAEVISNGPAVDSQTVAMVFDAIQRWRPIS